MNFKKMIKDTLIIAWLKSIPDLKRQPLVLVILAGLAAIPLFFIGLFGGESMLNIGIVGVIVSSIGFIGIAASIQDITWDRYVKLREMVVAMPVHPISYAMGLTLGSLIFALPGFLAFTAYGIYRGLFDPMSLLIMFAAMLMCFMGISLIGFTIATYQHKTSPNTLGIVANLLSFLFVFLPPVYYSESMLTNVDGAGLDLSWIAYTLPTTNAAAIIRYATGLTPWDGHAYFLHWLFMFITVGIFAVLIVRKARWREP
ncbi:MAG: ABC transporter permease [Thermoplasmata archaeon]|nr:ABC transporter permease [Thermoplasmata archaeon]